MTLTPLFFVPVCFQSLRQQCTRLENRSQLVTTCGLGPQVFLNCAGFIKIDTAAISDTTTNYIEVLDGSRVHPETYEWAKKMAVDALEYDEVISYFCWLNCSTVIAIMFVFWSSEKLLQSPYCCHKFLLCCNCIITVENVVIIFF